MFSATTNKREIADKQENRRNKIIFFISCLKSNLSLNFFSWKTGARKPEIATRLAKKN